jgi:hypothetical protein
MSGENNVGKMKKYNKEKQKGVCLPAQLATFVLMVAMQMHSFNNIGI